MSFIYTVPCGYTSNIPAVDLSTCTITGVCLWLVLANTIVVMHAYGKWYQYITAVEYRSYYAT